MLDQPLSTLAEVSASNFYGGAGPASIQGDSLVGRCVGVGFNSGGYAPQYVQLKLPGTYVVSSVHLKIRQTPNGITHHQLSVGADENSLKIITNLTGLTKSDEWINLTFNPYLTDVGILRLNTIKSPSWVAWARFLVYGAWD